MKHFSLIATFFGLLFSVTACTGDETVTGYGAAGKLWVLKEIDGQPFSARATLSFAEDGSVTGKAPCNTFGASQSEPYPWIKITGMRVTRSICPEIQAEQAFFSALGEMELVEVLDNTMLLKTEAGREMLFHAEQHP